MRIVAATIAVSATIIVGLGYAYIHAATAAGLL
jgi:hypothetical protein